MKVATADTDIVRTEDKGYGLGRVSHQARYNQVLRMAVRMRGITDAVPQAGDDIEQMMWSEYQQSQLHIFIYLNIFLRMAGAGLRLR